MPICKEYILAHTILEALQALAGDNGPARLVAGGTDLLIDLQQERCPPVHTLVDITEIEELHVLELRAESLFIGAAIPLAQLADSALVRSHAPALFQACDLVGGAQVRNMATLGGNVAHALPAGDGSIALIALDAQAEVVGPSNRYMLPVSKLFLAPGKSLLAGRQEILVGFHIQQAHPAEASAFQRVMRPQGVALPILNMAAWLKRNQDQIEDVRIAVGPAGQVPGRAHVVEQVLRSKLFTPELEQAAIDALAGSIYFRSSPQRASAAYRHHLASILLSQLLHRVWSQAGLKMN